MSAASVGQGRRVSAAARWAKSLSGFSLVLGATAAVGHRYGLVETIAYLWVLALVVVLALTGMVLAGVGFSRLWTYGDKAGKASLAALFFSGVVLAPFVAGGYFAYRYPALHDISTDLAEPPRFTHAARERAAPMNPILPVSPEAVALQREAYPDVTGRRFDASMERVLDAAQAVIAARGWRLRSPRPTMLPIGGELTIEMEAPTFLVGFPADAALRLTDEGETVFVDMRMSNRYGRHDLGDNARRIARFMSDLDAEFARQSLSIIDIPASSEGEDPVE